MFSQVFLKKILCFILVCQVGFPITRLHAHNHDANLPSSPTTAAQAPSSSTPISLSDTNRALLEQLHRCQEMPVCRANAPRIAYREHHACELNETQLQTLNHLLNSDLQNRMAEFRLYFSGIMGFLSAVFFIGSRLFEFIHPEVGNDPTAENLLISSIVFAAACGASVLSGFVAARSPINEALLRAGYDPSQARDLLATEMQRNRGWFFRALGRAYRGVLRAPSRIASGAGRMIRRSRLRRADLRSPHAETASTNSVGTQTTHTPDPTRVRIAALPHLQVSMDENGNPCVPEEVADEFGDAAASSINAAEARGQRNSSGRFTLPEEAEITPATTPAHQLRRRLRVIRDRRPPSLGPHADAIRFSREALSNTPSVLPLPATPAASATETLVPAGL